MAFGDIRDDWRINELERKIDAAPKDYEVHALRSSVDSMERTVRELGSEINVLRAQLSTLQDSVILQIQQRIDEIASTASSDNP